MRFESVQSQQMEMLSRLMVRAPFGQRAPDSDGEGFTEQDLKGLFHVACSSPQDLVLLRDLAESNHVTVRAFSRLQKVATALLELKVQDWCQNLLTNQRERIDQGISVLHNICGVLESRGCRVAVIKSLDHWPDLGSDFDLYTSADQRQVAQIMRKEFLAQPIERSWGDRLANKWNYRVPGLAELVEIHFRFLGQTGEHSAMAQRVIDRRMVKVIEGREFQVPAPEERIMISTLQRVYRHFYFRLCDMVDTAELWRSGKLRIDTLRLAAEVAGIWPGVATYLSLVQSYVNTYGGNMGLPVEVTASAVPTAAGVQFRNGFLRVPKRTAARLYGAQLLEAGRRRDARALARLPLLPPLALSAVVAYRLTGNDKGIW